MTETKQTEAAAPEGRLDALVGRLRDMSGWRPVHPWPFQLLGEAADEIEQLRPRPPEPEFTDAARSALLWVLWSHQGASSDVGQAIRFALGMGRHDRMTDEQLARAKFYGETRAAARRDDGETK